MLISLPKITAKDIEKLQESSLSEMERVSRALDEYNKKSEVKLTLGEFQLKLRKAANVFSAFFDLKK